MKDIVFVNNDLPFTLAKGIYYGIDLGTTYTVIASIDNDEISIPAIQLPVKLLNMEQHSPMPMDGSDKSEMMASILGVDNDRMFVGNKLYKLKGHPMFQKDKNLFYHWKLDLGINLKPLYKEAVRDDINDASKVAGKILNYSRLQLLENEEEWENVVVSVPASFLPNQRGDVLQAMYYAKISKNTSSLIDEPNAAILGYLNATNTSEKHAMLHQGSKHFLVIDFGGGTCDLSLLRLQLENNHILKMDNLSISRYNDLGGQDIDMIIAEQVLLPVYMEQRQSDDDAIVLETKVMPQLSVLAERLKIELSQLIASKYITVDKLPEDFPTNMCVNLKSYPMHIGDDFMLNNIRLSAKQLYDITVALFSSESYKLSVVDKVIRSLPSVIDDTLQKAGIKRSQIDYLLFVGGSVQNLLFIKECSLLLPKAQCLIPQRPDTLVAKGAAVYSFYKHMFHIDLICPIGSDTIGIITDNAEFYPLIKAGQSLPVQFDLSSFCVQHMMQRIIEIPLCIDNAERIVQIISIHTNRIHSQDDIISIKGQMDSNKVLQVQVWINGESIADVRILNPIALANLSDENRMVLIIENEYDAARMNHNTANERNLLLKLIGEYYELGNYDRCIARALEYLKEFDPTNSTAMNYLFCAYDNLGQKRKAKEIITKAVKYHSHNHVIQYNYTLMYESEKGRKSTIEYIKALPPDVRDEMDIKMRYAKLKHAEGDSKALATIIEDHKNEKFNPKSEFTINLLEQLYKLMGETWKSDEYKNNKKSKAYIFAKDNLLRVKDNVPDRVN